MYSSMICNYWHVHTSTTGILHCCSFPDVPFAGCFLATCTKFLPPCACARVKQSVLSIVIVIVMKIARSRVLGICACYTCTCNYHELVDIGKNWFLCTSNCWTWLTSATNRAFSVQHACGLPATPTPCADVTRLCMLDLAATATAQAQSEVLQC